MRHVYTCRYSCFGTSPLYKTLSHIKNIEVQKKERERDRERGRGRGREGGGGGGGGGERERERELHCTYYHTV